MMIGYVILMSGEKGTLNFVSFPFIGKNNGKCNYY